jgi:predicted acylesterase/phospholipase RssA
MKTTHFPRFARGLAAAALLATLVLPALPAPPARAAYGPPECASRLPQVLNMGLPYMEEVVLEDLEASLRTVIGQRYLESALCPDRPLRVNVALGSDYQILDWLDRGLVDMAVVPVVGLHLLRRDGLDLVEMSDSAAGAMEQLVGRIPSLTLTWIEGGETLERTGHAGDLVALADALWDLTAAEAAGPLAAGAAGEAGELPDPGHLVVPSHLSTAGFLMPVLTVEDALDSMDGAREASPEARRRFWEAFYRRVCFRFGEELGRRDGEACAAAPGSPRLEVAVIDEATASAGMDSFRPPVLGQRVAYRDRLVIRRGVADAVFGPGAIAPVELPEWDELHRLQALLDRRAETPAGEERLPTAFDGFLEPDGYFGTRTFAFRVGESLDLIEQHQRISGRAGLSLVLPGGGVKAAYQSRVLDELYHPGGTSPPRLRNAGAGAPDGEHPPLRVDSVVGTSGGALLGFFVARLGPDGPGDLSSILWKPDTANGSDRYLTASEIFGWTDLPRYISLVLVLCIFGLVLALFSWRRTGFLSPERRPEETPWIEPSVRPALLLSVLALLGLTPLVVRWVSGALAEEHVPEFEGLLYAVLLVLAMFADQCLIRTREVGKPPEERMAMPPGPQFVAGGLLIGLPVLFRFTDVGRRFLETEVSTGGVYLALALIVTGFGMVAVHRGRIGHGKLHQLAVWTGDLVVGTLAAWLVLRAVGPDLLAYVDRTPLLFLALFAALLVSAVVRLARGGGVKPGDGALGRLWGRGAKLARILVGHAGARFVAARVVSLLGCLIVLDLTRPEAAVFAETPLRELFFATSKLHAPRGPLAVCVGAVVLMFATILFLHRRRNHYRLEGVDRFRDAVLLVVTGLSFAVYLGLAVTVGLVAFLDGTGWLAGSSLFGRVAELTLFELTPAFWIGLAVASVVGSLVLVRWAWRGCRREAEAGEAAEGGRLARWICHCLAWLSAIHPNAHLMPRRVVRLGAIAFGGLVWWNFLLAPALYGNRYAFEYLEAADERFEDAYRAAHDSSSYRLTARYLAPANALSTDGTRFVLAVSDAEDCPAVPASPGVTWRRFRAVADGSRPKDDGCIDLSLAEEGQRRVLQDYIFASGSPFPAFPPRRVPIYDAAGVVDASRREALVDGGYSNNVPLEAAAKIGARQALVIHSSHPGPSPSEEGWFGALAGPLVDNLPRILGFLYERSQQGDRRSRSDLFVVSLAPPPADDWPLLTDFRSATVRRMIEQAEAGLTERIGMVESWGPPEFQTSLRVPEDG